jgi:hypothetical protein
MSDTEPTPAAPNPSADEPETVEVLPPGAGPGGVEVRERDETIEHPAKVIRIGALVRQLLEEVRSAPLDEPSRERMSEIYDNALKELTAGLSPDLAEELRRLASPLDDVAPSDAELRVVQSTLVGWLEGLFQGMQATLLAQQMAARQAMAQGGPPGLALGPGSSGQGQGSPQPGEPPRPGTYL